MAYPTDLAQIIHEAKRYKPGILGLSETRWNGTGELRTYEGYIIFS